MRRFAIRSALAGFLAALVAGGTGWAAEGKAVYQINCGNDMPAIVPFTPDRFFNRGDGKLHRWAPQIDVSKVAGPAPQDVYRSHRYARDLPSFTYTLPQLAPGGTYLVRLHFAETWYEGAGQRQFNVDLNGVHVLANFDIVAETGGRDKAIVKEFTTAADAAGRIVIDFLSITGKDWALISGIEIYPAAPPKPVKKNRR